MCEGGCAYVEGVRGGMHMLRVCKKRFDDYLLYMKCKKFRSCSMSTHDQGDVDNTCSLLGHVLHYMS